MYEAKVITDSVCAGHRLTTMQLTHPRIVHSEFMTHAMFARNASSSRAIPFAKMVQRVFEDPFIPEYWGCNEKGMQASSQLVGGDRASAVSAWLAARDACVMEARELAHSEGLNVHKQIVNRLLEPWGWITVCVTGDWPAWSNYFSLRCHKDAQPDIQKQAYMAQLAYFRSKAKELAVGEWHTPYVNDEDRKNLAEFRTDPPDGIPSAVQVSAGRCARTSYLTQEGVRDFSEDLKLHDRLAHNKPMHASPLEHVCKAMGDDQRYGKYVGWKAYRHMIPGEYVVDFEFNHPEIVGHDR